MTPEMPPKVRSFASPSLEVLIRLDAASDARPPEHRRHPADAEVWMRRILRINPTHQLLVVRILSLGAVIQTAAAQAQQIALSEHAQARMFHVDQHALAMRVQFDQSFFWSQSSSTFIWPICW